MLSTKCLRLPRFVPHLQWSSKRSKLLRTPTLWPVEGSNQSTHKACSHKFLLAKRGRSDSSFYSSLPAFASRLSWTEWYASMTSDLPTRQAGTTHGQLVILWGDQSDLRFRWLLVWSQVMSSLVSPYVAEIRWVLLPI